MVKFYGFLLFIFVLIEIPANAQITINRSDVDAAFLNTKRMNIQVKYAPSASINLGSASSSAQTFNFASITGNDTSRDTSVLEYMSPTGLPGADQFPGANIAGKIEQPPPDSGVIMTIVDYYSSEDNGFYGLGRVIHYVVPGLVDTILVSRFTPKALYLPLPLSIGTHQTAVDTEYSGPTNYTVSTRTYDANGFGTLTLPNGMSSQSIRVLVDHVRANYRGGVFDSHEHNRDVFFFSQDGSFLSFDDLDTNYISGTTLVQEYQMDIKTGTVDVREKIPGIPDQFILAQNFPNPFNPSTTISFQVTKTEFVSLMIFDVLGREVKTLVNSVLHPGTYDVEWDADDASGGVYYYKILTPSFTEIKKMVLAK